MGNQQIGWSDYCNWDALKEQPDFQRHLYVFMPLAFKLSSHT